MCELVPLPPMQKTLLGPLLLPPLHSEYSLLKPSSCQCSTVQKQFIRHWGVSLEISSEAEGKMMQKGIDKNPQTLAF